MIFITDKNECPLCYVRTIFGKCLKICDVKEIEKYNDRLLQFNPKEEQEKAKRKQIKLREEKKKQEESLYISMQHDILDWLKSLFQKKENPQGSEREKAIIKWFKDLFKHPTPKPKPNYDNYFF